MENEIKVGEYVRLDDGTVGKYQINNVVETNDKYIGFDIERDIVKHSPNLIDIIEERRLCKWRNNRPNSK